MMMTTAMQHGQALQYASDEMKNDRIVVMAAVEQYGGALQYASEELQQELRT